MSSKKGGGGRTYSNTAPSMRREGASSRSSGRGGGSARGGRGGRGRSSGMQAQAEVHGEASSSKKRVRSSRAQNAFGYEAGDWDGESQQHQAQRYESEAAKSREYVLPENFEDEDLDSDEEGIFNSDDENKYGDVFAKSSAAKGKKATAAAKGKGKRSTASTEDEEYEVEGDASEEDEDISGWEGAETINLSDMIGMDDAPAAAAAADDDDEEEESRPSKKQKSQKLSTAIKLTRKQIAEMQAKMNQGEEEDEDEELDEDEADEDEEADGSDDDEEMSFDGEEDDEDDDEAGGDAHKSLLSFVQGLKGGEDEESSGKDARAKRGRPQRGLQERNEAFEEGQFAIPKHTMGAQAAGAAAPAMGGLKLSDLLKKMPAASGGDDKAGDNAALTALKKKLAVLSNSAHTKTLAEPLPEIRQEEMTRALSYAKAKEEVARWTPIINRNRDAPTLSFPLNATPRINASSAELATRFKPSSENSLESDLAALMEGYGLKESSMLAAEGRELAAIHVTPEEASKREEGVAKMKALLFYHEQKLRRMHKIKSKTYRRLKKKQREKGKLSLEEMKELEPLAYEAEQRKAEQRRIEERMSLSHSNSSKWMAKQLQVSRAQKGSNTDIREAITEHAKRAQELRNKQESFPKQLDSEGEELSEDSDDDDEEEEEEDEDEDDDQEDGEDDEDADGQTKASKRDASRAAELRSKLRELEASLGSLEDAEPAEGFAHAPGTTKGGHKGAAAQEGGLVGLKFMQRAMEKKREETRAQIREFEAELEREEKREQMRRANRRAGLVEMDDEEIDVQIASSMPESAAAAGMDAASSAAAQRAGRKRVDVNTGAKGALVAAAAEDSVKLLPNSLQNASTGRSKASKTRVDGPITVAMPAAVGGAAGKSKSAKAAAATAAAVAQALQGGNAHPGQHHLIHGKSSATVDTPFISAEQSEQLFPLEKFSDDEDDAAAATGPNAQKVNLDKIKHDVRASIQQAKKKAIKGANKAASVRVGGIDDDEDDEDADADLEQAENGAAGSAAAAASEANPWAQTSVSNPRKAARMAAKAAKKAAFVKTGKVSFVADAGGDGEGDSDDGAEGADAIDLDLSGGVSLRSKRSEFDLLSGGNMSQAELVRRAFSSQGLDADGNGNDDGEANGAGPGVENEEQEFERLKREMMEEDLPKEETPVTGLPGWGAWGGLGASNFKSPAQLKKEAAEKARREARRAAANSSRADAKLKHVILNEKVDSKAMKYQVTTLPYPFTSLDQYERSLATPVGREWNTTSSFQQNVKPKVITKAGEIIEPAKFNPKVGQGAKEKAGKRNKAGGEAGQKRKR